MPRHDPKEMTAIRLDPRVLAAMRRYKERVGVPISVQIEKAMRPWLAKHGIVVKQKTASRRASTRRKA